MFSRKFYKSVLKKKKIKIYNSLTTITSRKKTTIFIINDSETQIELERGQWKLAYHPLGENKCSHHSSN